MAFFVECARWAHFCRMGVGCVRGGGWAVWCCWGLGGWWRWGAGRRCVGHIEREGATLLRGGRDDGVCFRWDFKVFGRWIVWGGTCCFESGNVVMVMVMIWVRAAAVAKVRTFHLGYDTTQIDVDSSSRNTHPSSDSLTSFRSSLRFALRSPELMRRTLLVASGNTQHQAQLMPAVIPRSHRCRYISEAYPSAAAENEGYLIRKPMNPSIFSVLHLPGSSSS